jgi:catechol 2,3-dioxygenase-like lactoylglutathione lyase family enzyme
MFNKRFSKAPSFLPLLSSHVQESSITMTMPHILQNHYVLAVHDLRVNAEFFAQLGFSVVNEPQGWVFVRRDNCMIMLGECRGAMPAEALGDHNYFAYLLVSDVDAFYAEVQSNGVAMHHALASKPWGMREFAVRTPEGHRIMIGEVIEQ